MILLIGNVKMGRLAYLGKNPFFLWKVFALCQLVSGAAFLSAVGGLNLSVWFFVVDSCESGWGMGRLAFWSEGTCWAGFYAFGGGLFESFG